MRIRGLSQIQSKLTFRAYINDYYLQISLNFLLNMRNFITSLRYCTNRLNTTCVDIILTFTFFVSF